MPMYGDIGLSIPEDLHYWMTIRILPRKMPMKLTTQTTRSKWVGMQETDDKKVQGKKNLPHQTFYEPELVPGETIKQMNARKMSPCRKRLILFEINHIYFEWYDPRHERHIFSLDE
ncbi:hypothetical protein ACEQPO_19875 [Bacillus sp. SL00103]